MTTGCRLSNGVVLPWIGLGTYRASGRSLVSAVKCALENGIAHIDTALAYKNADDVRKGRLAAAKPLEEVFVTSKIGPRHHGEVAATEACETALNTLKVDTLDLMLIHWPGAATHTMRNPDDIRKMRRETWSVLERFYEAGRFRAIGVSNYEVAHLKELMAYATVPPAVNQIEVHPRFQNREVRQFCRENNIQVVAYSSLGTGDLITHPKIRGIAEKHGKSSAQQEMVVIPKSVQEERILEWTTEAMDGWQLDASDMEGIDSMDDGHKYCWNPAAIS